jgi:hypothetical protein
MTTKKKDPKQSTVRLMTTAQAAWVGAMIEAEGSVDVRANDHGYVRIQVANTDVEIIATLLRFVGAGKVSLQTKLKPGFVKSNKPCWYWTIAAQKDVLMLSAQVLPWMSDKGTKLAAGLVNFFIPGFELSTREQIGRILKQTLSQVGDLGYYAEVAAPEGVEDDYATQPDSD